LLRKDEVQFEWDPPAYLPFEEDLASFDSEDLAPIRDQLEDLEHRLPKLSELPIEEESDSEVNMEQFERLRTEVDQMKAEVRDLLKLLYVHDGAVKNLLLQS
jgi:hypothetical protein